MAYIGVSPSNGVRRVHTYTATASQTTFSGAGAEGTSLSYKDSNFVDVYQNGIKLGDADYTSTSGTSIVLAQGASVDDLVVVVVFDVFSVADTVSKADGGTFDGDVTFAGAFTSQGIDDNANATAITIDSSENVMINTTNTNPAEGNVVGVSLMASNAISACDDGSAPIQLNRKTNDGDVAIFRKDGSSVGSIGTLSSQLTIGRGGVGLLFDNVTSDAIEPHSMSSNAIRSDAIDLGTSSSRFKDLYLSGGVRVGGTGSANLLNDYEEGTWTPGLSQYAGSPTFQDSFYRKIGSFVVCSTIVDLDGTSDTSAMAITGVPFTSRNTTNSVFGGLISYTTSTYQYPIRVLMSSNGTQANLYEYAGSTLSYNEFGNNKQGRFMFFFFT